MVVNEERILLPHMVRSEATYHCFLRSIMEVINIIYFDDKLGWVEDTLDLPGSQKSLVNQKSNDVQPKSLNSSEEPIR